MSKKHKSDAGLSSSLQSSTAASFIDLSRRDLLKLGGLSLVGLAAGCPGRTGIAPEKPTSLVDAGAQADAGQVQSEDAGLSDDAAAEQNDAAIDDANNADAAQSEDAGRPDANEQEAPAQPFVLLQLSDIHIGAQAFALNALRVVTQELVPVVNADMNLLTGDLVDQGDDDGQWDDYAATLADSSLDFANSYEQPGNHDSKSDLNLTRFLASTSTGQQTGQLYGYRDVLVDGRRLRLVAINTASGHSWAKNLPGYLDPDQVDDLIAQLAADSAVPDVTIIAGHHPPTGVNGLAATFTDDDFERLRQACDADAYLFGHVHRFKMSWKDLCLKVQAATLGNPSSTSTNPGFSLVTFDRNLAAQNITLNKDGSEASIDWPIVQITEPTDFDLGGDNPRAPMLFSGRSVELRALVFAPEAPDEVSFRVDDGDWQPMQTSNLRDSLYRADWTPPDAESCYLEVRARAMGHTRSHKISLNLI